ncbi:MAG: phosphatase PAP2 family protein, partial [Burkholderiales bacterium]
SVFKDHWGRARPIQVTEFGGSKRFTPMGVITNQCERNCSFVSGHASVGFYLMAFAWVTKQNRKIWFFLGWFVGMVIGGLRIWQGGHFLSDVIVAGMLIHMTCSLLNLGINTIQSGLLVKKTLI